MVDASLNHRCREAILSSPFEATVTANRLGPLMQYARETCLQPTHKPGQVYLRCECGLEEEDVLVQVRVRDGFTFNGPIDISAGISWHRDEHSVQCLTVLGRIDSTTPMILQTLNPGKVGVRSVLGSHFYLHVYFDLSSSAPPSASDAPTTLAAIEEERHKLSRLQGDELRAHVCKPLRLPHCRNLEFVYKVARLRYEELLKAWERDRNFELTTICDYLQSGLCDRLQGPHFDQRRKDLSSDLASLRRQNSPITRPRQGAAPPGGDGGDGGGDGGGGEGGGGKGGGDGGVQRAQPAEQLGNKPSDAKERRKESASWGKGLSKGFLSRPKKQKRLPAQPPAPVGVVSHAESGGEGGGGEGGGDGGGGDGGGGDGGGGGGGGEGDPSWRPKPGESVLYRDDEGKERTVTVTSVLHDDDEAGTTSYKIFWVRQTERRRLAHCNGNPLKKEELRSLRVGYKLVYNGYDDVSVARVLMDADQVDDDGDPRLEIEITRITTKVSHIL